ncbi:holo-ACP synthase [Virgibacillus sp. FSP13]
MIKGIGIDLVELTRIRSSIERNPRFIERILTVEERAVFEHLSTDNRKVEYLAGRFAAKEAFAKAVGTGIGKLSFQHIKVLPDKQGAPILIAEGFENANVFVSITHSNNYAAAQIVIEDK